MARYDAEAEARACVGRWCPVCEVGPHDVAGSLRAAHEAGRKAGAAEMRERAAVAAADALAEWSTRSIAAGRAIRALPTEPGEEPGDE